MRDLAGATAANFAFAFEHSSLQDGCGADGQPDLQRVQKNGLYVYGFNGQSSTPFQGGTKCVANPVKRSPILVSGGNVGPNDCSGVFEYEFNAQDDSPA